MTIALTACIGPIKPVPTQQSQEAPPPPTETADAPKQVEPVSPDAPPSPQQTPPATLPVPLPPVGLGQPIEPQEKGEMPVVESKPVLVAASRESYVVPNATSGTKTNTPIMETPLNVQVVTQQVLRDQQVINLSDALKNVSGVTTTSAGTSSAAGASAFQGGTGQSIFLRGFQSETFFRNGFRLQQGAASREMANVESVEVLKGPAAILYGLVEPGGMVNVITKQPLATPYYSLTQQFGSYQFYRTLADATGPLTKDDTLLYRMNMSYQNSDSFRDFVEKKDVFLAPVLRWNIGPRTQATAEFEYNHQRLGLDSGFIPLVNGQLLNMPRSRNYGEFSPGTVETYFGSFNWSHGFTDNWSVKHSFSVNQRAVDLSQYIFPLFTDNINVFRELQSNRTQYNTYSTNLDLTGHFETAGLKHTLLIGGDYYRLNTRNNGSQAFDDPTIFALNFSSIGLFNPVHPGTPFTQPLISIIRNQNRVDQYGLYVQDQVTLPYDIHVTGGFRYQNIFQSSQTQFNPVFGIPPSTSGASADAVTPRVGVLWHPQHWLSFYGNYVESFGPNPGTTFGGQPIAPSNARQYEGGIKTEFFGGRLRATFAYFDLTKTNIATADPVHPGFSIPIGAARSRGPEVDIQGEILPGWNIIATYANIDAFISQSNDSGFLAPGTRLFNVPRNTGSFWTTYTFQAGELSGLKLGGGTTIRDGQTACCDTPALSIPGYVTVDLLTAYSRNVGDVRVSTQLNVNNLLDQHYFTGLFTDSAFSNAGYADFGAPRTFLGSIRLEY
ncbi:MAG: TonB-dependent siderophore receptor [Nitrospirae bacterium]|nr:TonB-dependent siderophore receptor [Nitrospirota bacterium]